MIKLTYSHFKKELTDQLFDGIAYLQEEKTESIKRLNDEKYNYLFVPISSMSHDIGVVLNTLRYEVNHDKDCQKYKMALKNTPSLVENKPAPDAIVLFGYWKNLNNVILNVSLEVTCQQNDILVTKLSDPTLDVITAYCYVQNWLHFFNAFQISSFCNDSDKPLVKFRNKLTIFSGINGPNIDRVTLNNFSWQIESNYLQDTYIAFNKMVSKLFIKGHNHYFNQKFDTVMSSLSYLIDPTHFKHYEKIEQTANHGIDEVKIICNYFKSNSDDIRQWKWIDLDENVFGAQYGFLKKYLFEIRSRDIDNMKIRIKKVVFQVEVNSHIYTDISKVLLPLMSYHPSTIDCESYFSLKEWFIGSRCVHMSIPLLDGLLTLKINGPKKNDQKAIRKLCVDTAIDWNLKKNRKHKVHILDLLSSANNNNNDSDDSKMNEKSIEMKKLLLENNKTINNMNDYQQEEVFHNAEILSELIFSEKAIDAVVQSESNHN